ncbi:MAG: flagellar hook-length control protein FliK [Nitrospinae bacterium]|nr:flagellar hook-length control protein FliK [Nitrospinota bacterium]
MNLALNLVSELTASLGNSAKSAVTNADQSASNTSSFVSILNSVSASFDAQTHNSASFGGASSNSSPFSQNVNSTQSPSAQNSVQNQASDPMSVQNTSNDNQAITTNTQVTAKPKLKSVNSTSSTDGTQSAQTISMGNLVKSLNLSSDQVDKVARAFGTTADQLGNLQVSINGAQGGVLDATTVLNKISQALNLTNAQANEMFSSLNMSALGITVNPQTSGNSELGNQAIQSVTSSLSTPMIVSNLAQTLQSEMGNGGGAGFGGQFGQGAPIVQQTSVEIGSANFNNVLDVSALKFGSTPTANAAELAPVPLNFEKMNSDRIMGQIVEKASILQLPNSTETKITLSPETLGSVNIQLSMTDSSVKASIVVASNAVKQIVDQNIDQLKTALNQQGIMVDQINVSVGQQGNQNFGNAFSGQNPDQTGTPVPTHVVEHQPVVTHAGARKTLNTLVDLTA